MWIRNNSDVIKSKLPLANPRFLKRQAAEATKTKKLQRPAHRRRRTSSLRFALKRVFFCCFCHIYDIDSSISTGGRMILTGSLEGILCCSMVARPTLGWIEIQSDKTMRYCSQPVAADDAIVEVIVSCSCEIYLLFLASRLIWHRIANAVTVLSSLVNTWPTTTTRLRGSCATLSCAVLSSWASWMDGGRYFINENDLLCAYVKFFLQHRWLWQ